MIVVVQMKMGVEHALGYEFVQLLLPDSPVQAQAWGSPCDEHQLVSIAKMSSEAFLNNRCRGSVVSMARRLDGLRRPIRLKRGFPVNLDEVAIWIAKVRAANAPVATVVRWIQERCTLGFERLVNGVNIGYRNDNGSAILAFGIFWQFRSRDACRHQFSLE